MRKFAVSLLFVLLLAEVSFAQPRAIVQRRNEAVPVTNNITRSDLPVGQVGTVSHPNGYHSVTVYANVPTAAIDDKSTFFAERFIDVAPTMKEGKEFYDPQTKQFGCEVQFRNEEKFLQQDAALQGRIAQLVKGQNTSSGVASPHQINTMDAVGFTISLRLAGLPNSIVLRSGPYAPGTKYDGRYPGLARELEMAEIQNASLDITLLYEHKGMAVSSTSIRRVTSSSSKTLQTVLGVPTDEDISRKVFHVTRDMMENIAASVINDINLVAIDEPETRELVTSLDLLKQINSFFPEQSMSTLVKESENLVFYTKEMGRVDMSANTLKEILNALDESSYIKDRTKKWIDTLHEIAKNSDNLRKFFDHVKENSSKSGSVGGSVGYGLLSVKPDVRVAFTKDHDKLTEEETRAVQSFFEQAKRQELDERDFESGELRKAVGEIFKSINTAKEIVLHQVSDELLERSLQTSVVRLKSGEIRLVTCNYSIPLSHIKAESFLGNKFADFQAATQLQHAPVGSIVAFWGKKEDVPKGWAMCDNTLIPDDLEHQAIRKLIGGTNPRFPDLRGMFLRGIDGTREVGSLQNESFHSHEHTIKSNGTHTPTITSKNDGVHDHPVVENGYVEWVKDRKAEKFGGSKLIPPRLESYARAITFKQDGYVVDTPVSNNAIANASKQGGHSHTFAPIPAHDHGGKTGSFGGDETRPINIGVNYIIKL